MVEGTGISIRGLYKLFGAQPEKHVQLVRDGVSKTVLMQQHFHVLGLSDINLEIAPGSIQVIMGLSGSGKSTLIRHINRLIEPTVGEVVVGGADVVKMDKSELKRFRRHQTAMVFQRFALLPHRTVLENTVYGLEIQGARAPTRSAARCAGSSGSGSPVSRTSTRPSSRAACSSASASPAHSPTTRRSC